MLAIITVALLLLVRFWPVKPTPPAQPQAGPGGDLWCLWCSKVATNANPGAGFTEGVRCQHCQRTLHYVAQDYTGRWTAS